MIRDVDINWIDQIETLYRQVGNTSVVARVCANPPPASEDAAAVLQGLADMIEEHREALHFIKMNLIIRDQRRAA